MTPRAVIVSSRLTYDAGPVVRARLGGHAARPKSDLLAAEYAESGRAEVFAHLKVVLTESKGAVSGATLAERLGTTEAAAQALSISSASVTVNTPQDENCAMLDDPAESTMIFADLFAAMRRSIRDRVERFSPKVATREKRSSRNLRGGLSDGGESAVPRLW